MNALTSYASSTSWRFRANTRKITAARHLTVSAGLEDPNSQQQLNLSVLRFTLGIRGFDESYLPRGIGYAFGSLLVLNHFVGSYSPTTPAQLRTEALGLSLAAFSVALPYLGKFLKRGDKLSETLLSVANLPRAEPIQPRHISALIPVDGASLVDKPVLPEGNKQIFAISEHVSGTHKEDLAWGSYVILKNTNTISVLISVQGALCVRGYWSLPDDVASDRILDWFDRQIQLFGLSDLTDALYFPQSEDSGVWEMVPKGTRSLLIQPVFGAPELSSNVSVDKIRGFILLASSMDYAYSDKDRAWIAAVANKFRDDVAC